MAVCSLNLLYYCSLFYIKCPILPVKSFPSLLFFMFHRILLSQSTFLHFAVAPSHNRIKFVPFVDVASLYWISAQFYHSSAITRFSWLFFLFSFFFYLSSVLRTTFQYSNNDSLRLVSLLSRNDHLDSFSRAEKIAFRWLALSGATLLCLQPAKDDASPRKRSRNSRRKRKKFQLNHNFNIFPDEPSRQAAPPVTWRNISSNQFMRNMPIVKLFRFASFPPVACAAHFALCFPPPGLGTKTSFYLIWPGWEARELCWICVLAVGQGENALPVTLIQCVSFGMMGMERGAQGVCLRFTLCFSPGKKVLLE